jgi:hypothetical protein
MGTQQYLLIVLGVIIVGITIVVGALPSFERGNLNANRDAVTQDCLQMAAAAKSFYMRPVLLGGGGRSYASIRLRDCGMVPEPDGFGHNANGTYSIDGSAGVSCDITGHSNMYIGATVMVRVTAESFNNPLYNGW